MDDVETLINNSNNKEKIADIIYCRYYERYLKIFFYESNKEVTYQDDKGKSKIKKVFNTEYKNGFIMMASCCLLIETLSAFIDGNNRTPDREGNNSFEKIFNKAKAYSNDLQVFINKNLYKVVRCGILHQGETYKSFKIRRTGELYDESESAINATIFTYNLNLFMKSYIKELKTSEWDGELWDNCRIKLRHIVNNSRIK
jgi:hypothetical protein